MAIEKRSTNPCWLPPEPSTTSSHKGTKQLQVPSNQPTCAGAHKTRAQHYMKPQRQETVASALQATSMSNLCWLTREPSAFQAVPIASTQQEPNMRWLTETQHSRQETVASTRQATNMCWLTHEPGITSSHKGETQLQVHREQPICAGSHQSPALHQAAIARTRYIHTASSQHVLAHTRAQHHIKPQRQ